jgi:hypothetical protein
VFSGDGSVNYYYNDLSLADVVRMDLVNEDGTVFQQMAWEGFTVTRHVPIDPTDPVQVELGWAELLAHINTATADLLLKNTGRLIPISEPEIMPGDVVGLKSARVAQHEGSLIDFPVGTIAKVSGVTDDQAAAVITFSELPGLVMPVQTNELAFLRVDYNIDQMVYIRHTCKDLKSDAIIRRGAGMRVRGMSGFNVWLLPDGVPAQKAHLIPRSNLTDIAGGV